MACQQAWMSSATRNMHPQQWCNRRCSCGCREKATTTSKRWHETSQPRRTAVFSTAEESSVAEDEWFRSRPSKPRSAGSWRARRGKSAEKRPGMTLERSGAEGGGSDPVPGPRKTGQRRERGSGPQRHQCSKLLYNLAYCITGLLLRDMPVMLPATVLLAKRERLS